MNRRITAVVEVVDRGRSSLDVTYRPIKQMSYLNTDSYDTKLRVVCLMLTRHRVSILLLTIGVQPVAINAG